MLDNKSSRIILILGFLGCSYAVQAQAPTVVDTLPSSKGVIETPKKVRPEVSESYGSDPAGPTDNTPITPTRVREERSSTEGNDPAGPPEVPGNATAPKAVTKPVPETEPK